MDDRYREMALRLAERVGRERFGGDGQWAIDTVQRTIPDHFHLHVRDVSRMPAAMVGARLFSQQRAKL